jgi:hypothetical protein
MLVNASDLNVQLQWWVSAKHKELSKLESSLCLDKVAMANVQRCPCAYYLSC